MEKVTLIISIISLLLSLWNVINIIRVNKIIRIIRDIFLLDEIREPQRKSENPSPKPNYYGVTNIKL